MSAKVKLPDPLDKLLRSQLEKVIEEAAFHTDDELIARRRIIDKWNQIDVAADGANIAIPTGGTVEAITAAISINGEALNASTATITPAAAEDFFNIYVSAVVDVPRGCCVTVAARNTSTQPILVANSNFIVERIA